MKLFLKYTILLFFCGYLKVAYSQSHAENLYKSKQYPEALKFCNQVINTALQKKQDDSVLIYSDLIYRILATTDKRADFITYEAKVLHIAKKQKNDLSLKFFINLAAAYDYKGIFDKSENLLLTAKKRIESNQKVSPKSKGLLYNNYGSLLSRKGDFAKSIENYNIAIYNYQNLPQNTPQNEIHACQAEIALGYHNIANNYLQLGDTLLSKNYYSKSLLLFRKLENIFDLSNFIVNILSAISYYHINTSHNLDSASYYINKAYQIQVLRDQTTQLCRTYRFLGIISQKKNQFDASSKYLRQSIEYYNLNKNQTKDVGASYEELGNTLMKKNEVQNALKCYQLSLQYYSNNFSDSTIKTNPKISQIRFRKEIFSALKNKIEGLKKIGNYIAMQNAVYTADSLIDLMRREHTEEKSKLFWREKTQGIYANAIELCFRLKNVERAFYFIEKSRAIILLDALKNINAKNILPTHLQEKESEWVQKINLYNQRLASTPPTAEAHGELLKKLNDAKENREKFIKELEDNYPQYHDLKYGKSISLQAFKQQLAKNNQTYLTYFVADSCVYALGVSPQKTIFRKIIYKNYNADIQEFITQIKHSKTQLSHRYKVLAWQLYTKFVKPFVTTTNSLIVSADGALFPVEALLTSPTDGQSFLVKRLAISYAYSASTLVQEQQRSFSFWPKEILGFAPVNYNPALKLAPLYGSDVTINKIASGIACDKIYTQAAATKANFLKQAPSYDVLQLFTHGKDNYNGRGATLFFADSALYFTELYNLPTFKAKLAVLSACETGIGELKTGEGPMSMARGFAYLGIPSTATTLWSVSSQETYSMTEFFHHFLKNGSTKDEALRQAKLKMIDQNPAPYYWASMVIIGNTEPLTNYYWLWWAGFMGIVAIVFWLGYNYLRK